MLGLAAGISMLSANPAHAQGLFDTISKFFSAPPPARAPDQPPIGYADPFGLLTPEPTEKPNKAGPVVAYCVRLCDGRYFPLPRYAGTPHPSPDKICRAMCPASPTKVYSGSQIDQASASNGTRYSNIKNAFVYRERLVPDCTCNGKNGTGTAAIDIHSDPTLRSGDIVVTRDGPMVFKGSKQVPHRTSDFTAAKDYKGLPTGVRRTLAEMRVAPEPDTTARTAAMAPVPAPEPPSLSTLVPQASRAPYPRATPVAEAFSAGTVELQLETAVEIEPAGVGFRFTRWVRHD